MTINLAASHIFGMREEAVPHGYRENVQLPLKQQQDSGWNPGNWSCEAASMLNLAIAGFYFLSVGLLSCNQEEPLGDKRSLLSCNNFNLFSSIGKWWDIQPWFVMLIAKQSRSILIYFAFDNHSIKVKGGLNN